MMYTLEGKPSANMCLICKLHWMPISINLTPVSTSGSFIIMIIILRSPATMGFAQKLVVKRGSSDNVGKVGIAFLDGISGELWLMSAMMTDGATEAMSLLRLLDTELVDNM